jgi:hypothetical protein
MDDDQTVDTGLFLYLSGWTDRSRIWLIRTYPYRASQWLDCRGVPLSQFNVQRSSSQSRIGLSEYIAEEKFFLPLRFLYG